MKISISVGGLFHAPPLIKYLEEQGIEVEFITSYPKFILKKRGIIANKIKTIWIKEVMYQGYKKLFGKYPNNFLSSEVFDIIASYRISKNSDIYIIWAGFALHTIKRIKKCNPNAKIILERGSTHIEYQNEVLIDAYKKFEIVKNNIVPKGIIKKEKVEYELSDYIAIPTDFVLKTFNEKGVNVQKLFVNPYGVNLSLFSTNLENVTKTEIFTVIFVGLFSVQKGAFAFFEILEHFNKRNDIHFLIVGNIETILVEKVNFYVKEGILTYQPSVLMEQLPFFYNRSSVFLLPSVQEGLAMVLLQAMASRLPVIATPNSGVTMLITNNTEGFIVKQDDIKSFVEKLEFLLQNPDKLLQMGKLAQNKVLEGFSWSDYGKRNLDFYKKIKKDEKH